MKTKELIIKLSRDGWKVEIMPLAKGDFPYCVEAVKDGKRVDAYDIHSPAKAIKALADKIYSDRT